MKTRVKNLVFITELNGKCNMKAQQQYNIFPLLEFIDK